MSDWDEHAASWDDDPAVRAYAAGVDESLTSLLSDLGVDLTGAAVCDFGCGTGLLTERLADRCARIDAVDSSPAMLAVVRTKADQHAWVHVRPLAALPDSPERYDLIVCSSVLAFVDDHAEVVDRLAGHLAPGGVLVQWDWELDPDAAEPFGLDRATIARALERAGLKDVRVRVGFEAVVDGATMAPLMGSGRRIG